MDTRDDKEKFSEEEQHEIKESKNALFTLNHFPDGLLPKNIVVTDESLDYFSRAKLRESKDIMPGLVGVAFLGDSGKTLYLELLPAFNKNDGLERKDKHGKEYKPSEMAYTDEPLGGNSGRNHEQLIQIIEGRIQHALDNNIRASLDRYAGCYNIINEKVVLDKTKAFGYGVFKGDNSVLLHDFRIKSANINPQSVIYNPEFLYINYFDPVHTDDIFQFEYKLKRTLPDPVAQGIADALKAQLPTETLDAKRIIEKPLDKFAQPMFDTWEKIKDDSTTKTEYLIESLSTFLYKDTHTSTKEIDDIFHLIDKNISQLRPDVEERKLLFSEFFNKEAGITYNEKSLNIHPLITAIEHNKNHAAQLLIEREAGIDFRSDAGKTPIMAAVHKGNDDIVRLLLEKEVDLTCGEEPLLITAINQGHTEIAKLLIGADININLSDTKSNTALHVAAKMKNFEILKLLINKNADQTKANESKSAFTAYLDYPFTIENIENIHWIVTNINDKSTIYHGIKNLLQINDYKTVGHILSELKELNLKDSLQGCESSITDLLKESLKNYYSSSGGAGKATQDAYNALSVLEAHGRLSSTLPQPVPLAINMTFLAPPTPESSPLSESSISVVPTNSKNKNK